MDEQHVYKCIHIYTYSCCDFLGDGWINNLFLKPMREGMSTYQVGNESQITEQHSMALGEVYFSLDKAGANRVLVAWSRAEAVRFYSNGFYWMKLDEFQSSFGSRLAYHHHHHHATWASSHCHEVVCSSPQYLKRPQKSPFLRIPLGYIQVPFFLCGLGELSKLVVNWDSNRGSPFIRVPF